jgi:putative transposase
MSRRKRHNIEEVSAKLKQAQVLTAQGFGQAEIARKLEVSIMTLHRWRKGERLLLRGSLASIDTTEQTALVAGLLDENSRLRRLITDLMLEKSRIEENAADAG